MHRGHKRYTIVHWSYHGVNKIKNQRYFKSMIYSRLVLTSSPKQTTISCCDCIYKILILLLTNKNKITGNFSLATDYIIYR